MIEMPEKIWLRRTHSDGKHFSAVRSDSPLVENRTQYCLKSAEDKTIRELAAALREVRGQFLYYERLHTRNGKDDKALTNRKYAVLCEQTLVNNAPRIAEAQEGGG